MYPHVFDCRSDLKSIRRGHYQKNSYTKGKSGDLVNFSERKESCIRKIIFSFDILCGFIAKIERQQSCETLKKIDKSVRLIEKGDLHIVTISQFSIPKCDFKKFKYSLFMTNMALKENYTFGKRHCLLTIVASNSNRMV